MPSISRFGADRRGATLIEYSLIAALIGITIMATLFAFGGTNHDLWQQTFGKIVDGLQGNAP